MSKAKYIVMSDSGQLDCGHTEHATKKDAWQAACKRAETSGLGVEYAIYEKIAVSRTQPASADIEPIEQESPNDG